MRHCGVEGVDELLWVSKDKGAFGSMTDGPLFDWISDSVKFMENVKKFETVLQAGGNCGMYARFYSNYFDRVITFEPEPLNFYCLDRNCVGPKFVKYNGGLGNTTTEMGIKQGPPTNVGMHKMVPGEGTKMYRIDDLDINSCDLIHLDVEGYETEALKGAIETIKKFMPIIITERSNGESILRDLGYVMQEKLRMDTVYVPKNKTEV